MKKIKYEIKFTEKALRLHPHNYLLYQLIFLPPG